MSSEEARTLMASIHGHWPTLSLQKNGKWNKDVADSWEKYLMTLDYKVTCEVVRDFFLGETPMPRNTQKPAFKDIRFEVKRRVGMKPALEAFYEASDEPISLAKLEHGQYVALSPPSWPPWENALPGGRVFKCESGDWIGEIPLPVSWHDFEGYLLLSAAVTRLDFMKYIIPMNAEQEAAWTKQMREWQVLQQIKRFSEPWKSKEIGRGGQPSQVFDLF